MGFIGRLRNYKQLAGSGGATCGLKNDGTMQCWGIREKIPDEKLKKIVFGGRICGLNMKNKLVCSKNIAGDDHSDIPEFSLLDFDLGPFHACGIREQDKSLVTWSNERPLIQPEIKEKFTQVTASNSSCCAISINGEVTCFGKNKIVNNTIPQVKFKQISAAAKYVCGITDDNDLKCWGQGADDLLKTPLGKFKIIAAMVEHTCAVKITTVRLK